MIADTFEAKLSEGFAHLIWSWVFNAKLLGQTSALSYAFLAVEVDQVKSLPLFYLVLGRRKHIFRSSFYKLLHIVQLTAWQQVSNLTHHDLFLQWIHCFKYCVERLRKLPHFLIFGRPLLWRKRLALFLFCHEFANKLLLLLLRHAL